MKIFNGEKRKCFDNDDVSIVITGNSNNEMLISDFKTKTFQFTLLLTCLAIAATYFTIKELKEVSNSLEQRQMVGQSENYAKKLSIFTNCMICMWNMCYAITFFVCALSF